MWEGLKPGRKGKHWRQKVQQSGCCGARGVCDGRPKDSTWCCVTARLCSCTLDPTIGIWLLEHPFSPGHGTAAAICQGPSHQPGSLFPGSWACPEPFPRMERVAPEQAAWIASAGESIWQPLAMAPPCGKGSLLQGVIWGREQWVSRSPGEWKWQIERLWRTADFSYWLLHHE